jgi:hypothetical protein
MFSGCSPLQRGLFWAGFSGVWPTFSRPNPDPVTPSTVGPHHRVTTEYVLLLMEPGIIEMGY